MSDVMSALLAALFVVVSHTAVCQLSLCYMDKHVVGFTSATSAPTLLFYAFICFRNNGSLNCIYIYKYIYSTLAWLQTYKIVQILLCCCFEDILERHIALCPVFARCCLFTVMCSSKTKKKKKTMI